MKPKLQDRLSSLNLYIINHRAVIDVENPTIFSRPDTEGRFLSQKLGVISIAGTSWVNEHRSLAKNSCGNKEWQNISVKSVSGSALESGIYKDITG